LESPKSCSKIFIEAFREASVKAAVAGIADLYSWKPGAIKIVPINEASSWDRLCVSTREYRVDVKGGCLIPPEL
jgi:hypothetical protein